MSTQDHKILEKAIKDLHIQDSRTLETVEVGKTSLLSNTAISEMHADAGTVFATQNNVQIADISRTEDSTDLIEVNWNYQQMTSKPYFVGAVDWTTSSPVGSDLTDFNFPYDYFTANHVLLNVAETFLSFRGDLHFVATVQGTPLASGAIILSADYQKQTGLDSFESIFARNHVIVDVSDNSSTADLVVPFRYWRNSIEPLGSLAKIRVTVLTPLAGIPSTKVTLTCFLEHQEFKFLRPESAPQRMTQGLLTFTTVNNNLNNVTNATLPSNITGDSLSATVRPMDDVGVSTNPNAVVVKFNSLNNTDNPHYIEKTTLHSNVQHLSTQDTFNTKMDEMDILELCKRESYLSVININDQTAAYTPIFEVGVIPNVRLALGDEKENLIGSLASYHQFWRGGLKYRFRFHMNRFQSIKLFIGLYYKSNAPTSVSSWSSAHGVIVDVGGDQREIIVEVPYNSEVPWLNVPHTPFSLGTGVKYTDKWDYYLGTLQVVTLSPLISPAGSPTNTTCHVTMSAADDFQLAHFSPANRMRLRELQGELLLSQRSKRTPNYINDVSDSVATLCKKWMKFGRCEVSTSGSVATMAITRPANAFLPLADDYGGSLGNVNFKSCESRNIPLSTLYAGYRGNVKVRIEMEIRCPKQEFSNFSFFRPYCYWVPGNLYLWNSDAFIENCVSSVVDYSTYTALDESNDTPYLLQPVNVSARPNTLVYEMEIPLSHTWKYLPLWEDGDSNPRDNIVAYGTVLSGVFTNAPPEESLPDFNVVTTSYIKIGDDGRFGILNKGEMLVSPSKTWTGTN